MATDHQELIKQLKDTLYTEPSIDHERYPLAMEFCEGVLTIAGEVDDVATKKRALYRMAAFPQIRDIVDRIQVSPAEIMGDGAICAHVSDAMLQEPAFLNFSLTARLGPQTELIRERVCDRCGAIEVSVEAGVVTLAGQVPSLSHKRLAGVLSWWVPGSRDVINMLVVEPPEEDTDDEISDAVRLVLEKDPFVNPLQVRIRTRNRVVTLDGLLPSESERDMAESDAWYVLGVDNVINRIAVGA